MKRPISKDERPEPSSLFAVVDLHDKSMTVPVGIWMIDFHQLPTHGIHAYGKRRRIRGDLRCTDQNVVYPQFTRVHVAQLFILLEICLT